MPVSTRSSRHEGGPVTQSDDTLDGQERVPASGAHHSNHLQSLPLYRLNRDLRRFYRGSRLGPERVTTKVLYLHLLHRRYATLLRPMVLVWHYKKPLWTQSFLQERFLNPQIRPGRLDPTTTTRYLLLANKLVALFTAQNTLGKVNRLTPHLRPMPPQSNLSLQSRASLAIIFNLTMCGPMWTNGCTCLQLQFYRSFDSCKRSSFSNNSSSAMRLLVCYRMFVVKMLE